jgi:hypothetical protein
MEAHNVGVVAFHTSKEESEDGGLGFRHWKKDQKVVTLKKCKLYQVPCQWYLF